MIIDWIFYKDSSSDSVYLEYSCINSRNVLFMIALRWLEMSIQFSWNWEIYIIVVCFLNPNKNKAELNCISTIKHAQN